MDCCDEQDIYQIDGFPTCTSCGCVDINKPQYVNNYFSGYNSYKHNIVIYERINYFKVILNNIRGGFVDSAIDHELKIISELLKKEPKMTIHELKKWMKLNKYNNYVKYIYRLYYFTYNIYPIKISKSQNECIIKDFKKYNVRYIEEVKKRNQMNYNFIIYKLCKKNKIDASNILLPDSKNRLNKIYSNMYI